MADDVSTVDPAQSRGQFVALAIVVVVAALVGGYFLAQYLYPKPKIGVIYLQDQVSRPASRNYEPGN